MVRKLERLGRSMNLLCNLLDYLRTKRQNNLFLKLLESLRPESAADSDLMKAMYSWARSRAISVVEKSPSSIMELDNFNTEICVGILIEDSLHCIFCNRFVPLKEIAESGSVFKYSFAVCTKCTIEHRNNRAIRTLGSCANCKLHHLIKNGLCENCESASI